MGKQGPQLKQPILGGRFTGIGYFSCRVTDGTGSGDLLDVTINDGEVGLDPEWVAFSYTFTAASTETTLRIRDNGTLNVDPAIDTVSILAQSRLFVDTDATGANDGSSWTDAITDLTVGAIPEPAALAALAGALALACAAIRRRRA